MIDFHVEEERICLIDGKWYRYNQSFVNFLRREADSIAVERGRDKSNAKNPDEFIAVQAAAGFIDCRKAIAAIDERSKVNKLDLYKDGTIYFIKFGNIESVNYAVDQAINAARFLQGNRGQLVLDEQTFDIEKMCLWLVPDNGLAIDKISQIDSLNFLMKISDFKRSVLSAGFRARIRID
jgi:hypothetical protein